MSYSRWSNSRWYTFWRVHRRDERETRNNAIFTVMDALGEMDSDEEFDAAEIRNNVTACVGRFSGTIEELAELKGYMLEFLEDVDAKYPKEHA